MPLSPTAHTAEDYWNLPDGQRAELIGGVLYDVAPPSRIHQKLVGNLARLLGNHSEESGGPCEVYPAPFAVNLDANGQTWVEPDVSVICDPDLQHTTVYLFGEEGPYVMQYPFQQPVPVGIWGNLEITVGELA